MGLVREIYSCLTRAFDYGNVEFRFSQLLDDPILTAHTKVVAFYSVGIGIITGLPDEDMLDLSVASILHDYGRLDYQDIINKPGKLTEEEFKKVMEHPRTAFIKLENDITLRQRKVIVGHHEYQENSYPRTEKRFPEDPLVDRMTQILAVADQASAMVCSRTYKPSYVRERTLEAIKNNFSGEMQYIEVLEEVMSSDPSASINCSLAALLP